MTDSRAGVSVIDKITNHGKVINGARICKKHGEHGDLYQCEEYDEKTIAEINEMNQAYLASLKNKEWRDSQIKNGVPSLIIDCFSALAGISERDGND